jgi:hypothetical protein
MLQWILEGQQRLQQQLQPRGVSLAEQLLAGWLAGWQRLNPPSASARAAWVDAPASSWLRLPGGGG